MSTPEPIKVDVWSDIACPWCYIGKRKFEAGAAAAKAGVKHLVLTHFYPECDAADVGAQCRGTWQGPLTLAEDLMKIRISPSR